MPTQRQSQAPTPPPRGACARSCLNLLLRFGSHPRPYGPTAKSCAGRRTADLFRHSFITLDTNGMLIAFPPSRPKSPRLQGAPGSAPIPAARGNASSSLCHVCGGTQGSGTQQPSIVHGCVAARTIHVPRLDKWLELGHGGYQMHSALHWPRGRGSPGRWRRGISLRQILYFLFIKLANSGS